MDAILDDEIAAIRDASRRLVRELGFMRGTLAGSYELEVAGERVPASVFLDAPYDPKGTRIRA